MSAAQFFWGMSGLVVLLVVLGLVVPRIMDRKKQKPGP